MARRAPSINPRLVDQHFRVVIPREVRDALRVKQGSHVSFIVTGGFVEMRKVHLTLE
jgi:AbrB family looped-hinge helix DNA binding protein